MDIINNDVNVNLPLGKGAGLPNLGGAKVRVVAVDHQGKPDIGLSEAERLITQEKAVALFGAYVSAMTSTASQVAERVGVPFVNADSSSPALTERGFKWFFRTSPHDGHFSQVMFDFMQDFEKKRTLEFKSVAILNEDTTFGTDSAKVQETLAQKYGYAVAAKIAFRAGTTSLDAEVGRMKSANADVFLPSLVEPDEHPFPTVHVSDRTSWSCHHGVARWSAECPDAADGHWKAPLRAALERLAAGIDAATEGRFRGLPGSPDPWVARDEYIDVVLGVEPAPAFSARWLGEDASARERHVLVQLLEAQRWRLAMFASDGWFWDDPIRPETKQVLRCAARAVRIVDEVADMRLERRLVADLELFRSPSTHLDGGEIYRLALSEVGQPVSGR